MTKKIYLSFTGELFKLGTNQQKICSRRLTMSSSIALFIKKFKIVFCRSPIGNMKGSFRLNSFIHSKYYQNIKTTSKLDHAHPKKCSRYCVICQQQITNRFRRNSRLHPGKYLVLRQSRIEIQNITTDEINGKQFDAYRNKRNPMQEL